MINLDFNMLKTQSPLFRDSLLYVDSFQQFYSKDYDNSRYQWTKKCFSQWLLHGEKFFQQIPESSTFLGVQSITLECIGMIKLIDQILSKFDSHSTISRDRFNDTDLRIHQFFDWAVEYYKDLFTKAKTDGTLKSLLDKNFRSLNTL